MSVAITINVADKATPAINEVLRIIGPRNRQDLNKVAAREVVKSVRRYHRRYNAAGKWRKSGGGGSTFGEQITRAWSVGEVGPNLVKIVNAGPHYRQKVRGGTIRAKRAKALTIPLIPEAKGRFAAVYQQVTGRKLFRPKGKNVLMEKTRDGGVRAVYALKKAVTQRPWPGALPPNDRIIPPFVASIERQIADAL